MAEYSCTWNNTRFKPYTIFQIWQKYWWQTSICHCIKVLKSPLVCRQPSACLRAAVRLISTPGDFVHTVAWRNASLLAWRNASFLVRIVQQSINYMWFSRCLSSMHISWMSSHKYMASNQCESSYRYIVCLFEIVRACECRYYSYYIYVASHYSFLMFLQRNRWSEIYLYGLSPVWVLICCFSLPDWVNAFANITF